MVNISINPWLQITDALGWVEHHWASETQFDDVAFGQVMPGGNHQPDFFLEGMVLDGSPISNHI